MRRDVMAAAVLLVLAGASAASGGVTILDGPLDPVITPFAIGLTEPSIDLRRVSISGDGTHLVVDWEVEDQDFRLAGLGARIRGYSLVFGSELHNEVIVSTAEVVPWNEWLASVWCHDADGQTSCLEDLQADATTLHGDTVRLRVPHEIAGRHILHPRAIASAFYQGVPFTNVAIFDVAPDCLVITCPPGPDYYAP